MGLKVRGGRRPRLEVKSNVDLGWYDGGISLVVGDNDYENDGEIDPEKLRVRVHFTDFEETEDEFWEGEILRSEQEIRTRVRLLSHQLQDKECDKVVPGIVVCAKFESSDGVECKYYDALVTAVSKAAHGRQDRDEICYCSFTIKWEEGPARGTYATVNCPDISLIVARDVGQHPLVRALLDFARNYSVVTPGVSQLAKPEEEITPGSQASLQNAPNLEHEASPEEELETVEVEEHEGFEVESPRIEEVQEQEESFVKEVPEEVNQEQDMLEDRVEGIEVQEREGFRGEKLEVNEVRKAQSSGEENLEVKREQVQEAEALIQERPEIEGVQEQEIVEMKFEDEENGQREGLREDEPEEEQKQEERKHEADVIELDWDEELQVEKIMDEIDSPYRVLEDNFLDLPKDISDYLRNFQLLKDCLAKETLEIEKFLVEKEQKQTNYTIPRV